MRRFATLRAAVCLAVAVTLPLPISPLPLSGTAWGRMISTEEAIAAAQAEGATAVEDQDEGRAAAERQKLDDFLSRDDVRVQLVRLGVSPQEALERAQALSSQDVHRIAGRLDEQPAGGEVGMIIGVALFIFVLLLITDIFGLTKIFPFTRSIR